MRYYICVSEEKTNQLLKREGKRLLIGLLINIFSKFSKLSLYVLRQKFFKIKDWYENFEVESS